MKLFLTLGTATLLTLSAAGAFADDIKVIANADTGVTAEQIAEADIDGEIVVENEVDTDTDTETDASGGVLVEGTVEEEADTMVLETNDEMQERIQEIEGVSEIGTDIEAASIIEIE